MALESTFLLIRWLICFSIIIQTLELISLKRFFLNQGVWRWNEIKKDFSVFPSMVFKFLNFTLHDRTFIILIWLRLFFAIMGLFPQIPFEYLSIELYLISLLICVRFRGTFNGGSDHMTLIVLLLLTMASFASNSEKVQLGCLWYLAIQTLGSYFISGVIKLKHARWRNGQALIGFLNHSIYEPSPYLKTLSNRKNLAKFLSWILLSFEISFPIILIFPETKLFYLGFGLFFHFMNFWEFGLNRFFWTWLATYPALYFVRL